MAPTDVWMGRMTVLIAIGIGLALLALEKKWPAAALPSVQGWGRRVILANVCQAGMVLLGGMTWDRWLSGASVLNFRSQLGDVPSAGLAYAISTFVYYWWHRARHESRLFWRLCHQLHHSPRRIELLTSFYKHPVEQMMNAMISSAIVYGLCGCSVRAAAWYSLMCAVAEYFYHLNIRTPRWLGFWVQRPEAHRVHHRFGVHTDNFADLPLWDMLFGTFENPRERPKRCGFTAQQEGRVGDMLAFQDVLGPEPPRPEGAPQPTCLGCRKRWICAATREERAS